MTLVIKNRLDVVIMRIYDIKHYSHNNTRLFVTFNNNLKRDYNVANMKVSEEH